MTAKSQPEQDRIDAPPAQFPPTTEPGKVICTHCQRTATNGIKCKGICVADSDY